MNNWMNCWNISLRSTNHNGAGDGRRDGLKIVDQRQSAAKLELRNGSAWSLFIEYVEHFDRLVAPGYFFWRQRCVTAMTFAESMFPLLMNAFVNLQRQCGVLLLDEQVRLDCFEKRSCFLGREFSGIARLVSKWIFNRRSSTGDIESEFIPEPMNQDEVGVDHGDPELDEAVLGAVVMPPASVMDRNTSLSVNNACGVGAFKFSDHLYSMAGIKYFVKLKKVQRLGGAAGTINHPRASGTPIGVVI